MVPGAHQGYRDRMHFDLVDRVVEQSADRIVTLKLVSGAEEYLRDHFPTFPVLPGVLMLEAMVQAGRRLAEASDPQGMPFVLAKVRALKYGRFVKPGHTLRIEIEKLKDPGDGTLDLRGEVVVIEPGITTADSRENSSAAASGRFTLRRAVVAKGAAGGV